MRVGLYAPDSKTPNYALMKLSAYHKARGDSVGWYTDMWGHTFDCVYCSKIFTFTPEPSILNDEVIIGGSGESLKLKLPVLIDDLEPDYSIYPDFEEALGFLTRGCIRRCEECLVPEKEGNIEPYRDIQQIAQYRKNVILMDNNVLASDHGIKQIEKIIKLKLKVDFNQGLDARLIDNKMAKLLSKVKWLEPLRMACDNLKMIKHVEKATKLLRKHNCTPKTYSIYVLVKEIETALERVMFLKKINLDPFAQPYRDFKGTEPTQIIKDFARWVNMKAIFKTVKWEDYNA